MFDTRVTETDENDNKSIAALTAESLADEIDVTPKTSQRELNNGTESVSYSKTDENSDKGPDAISQNGIYGLQFKFVKSVELRISQKKTNYVTVE